MRSALLTIAALAFTSPALGAPRWSAHAFTTADGLSQSGVESIVRDADGYLWVGTQDGLNRFDGASFTRFFVDDGLPANFIDALLVDRDNRLWVATDGGIAVRAGAAWTRVALPDEVAGAKVLELVEIGPTVYAMAKGELVAIEGQKARVVARGEVPALRAIGRQDGTLLAGTLHGLFALGASGAWSRVHPELADLAALTIDAILAAPDGALWLGAQDHGLYVLDTRGALRAFGEADGLGTRHVHHLFDGGAGAVLVATFDDGLYRIQAGRASRVTGASHSITSALVDDEGTTWASDFTLGGLVRLAPARFETITADDGLPTNDVFGILHAKDGATWLATATGLVRREGDRFVPVTGGAVPASAEFTGIAEAPDGTVCAGTLKKGAYCFRGGAVTAITRAEGLPGDTVNDLAFDRHGALWLATSEGVAVARDGKVVRTLRAADGLLDASIYTIFEDRAGVVWIGYAGRSGVTAIDGAKLTHATERDGLPHGGATAFLEDARGRLWICTDGGLALKTADRFRAFSKKDGLPSDEVYVALEDADGALWLGTDDGVAKFDGERVVTTYTIDDGLAGNEGQSRGGAKDARGRMWFASTGGLTIIDGGHVPRNDVPPRVRVERMEAGGQSLEASVSSPLPYAWNNVRFAFTATSLREPRTMRFAYRLDGFDREWTTMAAPVLVRAASYTNLPPGDYAFEVKATNNDGVWSPQPAVLRFRIATPWWRAWWALAIGAVSLVGAGYGATLLRLRGLRARAAILEAKVAERTRELADKTLVLDAQVEQLKKLNDDLLASQQRADRIFSALTIALPGTVLDGKYKLEERVGSGGFGVVFRAQHLELRRAVAVKVFRPQPGNDSAEAAERFRREAISACRVQHKNAVAVYDSGISSEGILYLVMELLDGASLADVLAAEPRLSLGRTLEIAIPLCEALASAHAQGIIHRDVKPENVVLHETPAGTVVKVVDFGVARLMDAGPFTENAQLTQTDAIIGTPVYMAPERLTGDAYDGRSDVYSVGVILYQCLSGHLPFETEEPGLVAKIMKQVNEEPVPLRARAPDLPERIEEIVMHAIHRSLGARPNAEELAGALAAALRELPRESLEHVAAGTGAFVEKDTIATARVPHPPAPSPMKGEGEE